MPEVNNRRKYALLENKINRKRVFYSDQQFSRHTLLVYYLYLHDTKQHSNKIIMAVPEDLIVHNILPFTPTHFLCVSKAYNQHALTEIIKSNINNNFLLCNYIKHNISAVEMLLQQPQINPSANFNKAMEEAIRYRSISAVKLLVEHPQLDEKLGIKLANLENHQEDEERESTSILGASVLLNAPDVVSVLLSLPDKFDPSESYSYPMRLAARYNFTNVARELFKDKRTSLSIPFDEDRMRDVVDDFNPLWYAASHGNEELVKLYLSDDRISECNLDNALERASCVGHANVVKILLEDNRIEDIVHAGGNSLLYACSNDHTAVIQELLKDKRIDPNYEEGRVLIMACENRQIDILQVLLSDPRTNIDYVVGYTNYYDRSVVDLLKRKTITL